MKAIFLTNASQNDDIHRDSTNGNEIDRQQQLQKQKNLRENLEFEQGMLVEREQRVQQIEADVLDVNEIMRDLATLINIQGEQIGKLLATFSFLIRFMLTFGIRSKKMHSVAMFMRKR